MRRILFYLITTLILGPGALAFSQSNSAPVRLAIVIETPEVAAAGDLLTAELSKGAGLQLLERAQIEKVYREQASSAANTDYLKLGKMLGADGLLLLNTRTAGTSVFLNQRLIAVNPGVILAAGRVAFPLENPLRWAAEFADYLKPLRPKLAIPDKDAVPLSMLNLRSAVQTSDEVEMERQLTLLTIQRLTRQPRIFVLERQRMELLSAEKELKLDDSKFWRGSYLLEGVVDGKGYSGQTVTIEARLTPPSGQAPVAVTLTGDRTNLNQIVNEFVQKIAGAMNVRAEKKQWSSAEEAEQYFKESNWARQWDMFAEAQAAAESAWALGKQDEDCAITRIRAYTSQVPVNPGAFQVEQSTGSRSAGNPVPWFNDPGVNAEIREMKKAHPLGLAYRGQTVEQGIEMTYCNSERLPDPTLIEPAQRALDLYLQFSRTLDSEEPKPHSAWCRLGIETLEAASQVLQHFHFVETSQRLNAERLARLRASSREVANWISRSTSVRASYFVGDRIATHDELGRTIQEQSNIFSCQLAWGFLWQEKPDDCVALYRELMTSPVFSYLHRSLWYRPLARPRIAAWNDSDRARKDTVWQNFLQDLETSTNFLWKMEAKALKAADAPDIGSFEMFWQELFQVLFAHSEEIVTNNVELLNLKWGLGELINGPTIERTMGSRRTGLVTFLTSSRLSSATRERLQQQFYSEYSPRLEALNRRYWNQTVVESKNRAAFEKQKQYLAEFTPYKFSTFAHAFGYSRYTPAQAMELEPLVAAYKSNLVASLSRASNVEQLHGRGAVARLGLLENLIHQVLNPLPARAPSHVMRSVVQPSTPDVQTGRANLDRFPKKQPITNALLITDYIEIPYQRLRQNLPREEISRVHITSEHSDAGKLCLIVSYHQAYYEYLINHTVGHDRNCSAAFVWNSSDRTWEIISIPPATAPPNWTPKESAVLLKDVLYISGWTYLRRYDLKSREWRDIPVPWQKPAELYRIGDHLFAGNEQAIFEISGETVRILASTRRRPAASSLDSLEKFSNLSVFAGPNGTICATIASKAYAFEDGDWRELFALENTQMPEAFADAVTFRRLPTVFQPGNLWLWKESQSKPELLLADPPLPMPNPSQVRNSSRTQSKEKPRWKSDPEDLLTASAAVFCRSNLYLFSDHAAWTNAAGMWRPLLRDGCHARLFCFDEKASEPSYVPLRFDLKQGLPPLKSLGEKRAHAPWLAPLPWIISDSDSIYIGQSTLSGMWKLPLKQIESRLHTQRESARTENE